MSNVQNGQCPTQKSYKKVLRIQKECGWLFNFFGLANMSAGTLIRV